MEIRRTKWEDLPVLLRLYESARKFMSDSGNGSQWGTLYPDRRLLEEDISRGCSYVCENDGEIVGTFFFTVGIEPTYLNIFDGKWLNDTTYGFIHRMTTVRAKRGVASYCLDWCFRQIGNIRVDTHRNNIPMQSVLEKNGYKRCGTIYLENGDERIAYQKV